MSDYRKLRTIYDALDAHNFKQSLKLCDAALKKAADTSMVKALKAVTLERMGRTEEGLKLARDVASALAPPADDHLLSTLNIVFKATGHSAEGAAAYASAFEQEPKNEELGASLFGACCCMTAVDRGCGWAVPGRRTVELPPLDSLR